MVGDLIDLLKRAERVLIYAIGTKHLKLTYTKTDKTATFEWAPRVTTLDGHSDSTFDLAHSTTGWLFRLANAAFDWGSTKQESVALTSQHAEIVAGSVAACAAIGHRGILDDTGYPQLKPTVLYMDNTSAIDLAFDPVMPSKTKHIARRDLFIRELVERKVIEPKFIPTAKNTADALTKPLARGPFQTHRNKLMGLKID